MNKKSKLKIFQVIRLHFSESIDSAMEIMAKPQPKTA